MMVVAETIDVMKQLHSDRRALEEKFREEIYAFERKYGVRVTAVDLSRDGLYDNTGFGW